MKGLYSIIFIVILELQSSLISESTVIQVAVTASSQLQCKDDDNEMQS